MIKILQILTLLVSSTFFAQTTEPNFFIYKAYPYERTEPANHTMQMILKQETDSIQYELQYENHQSYFYPIHKIDNSQNLQISMHDVFRKTQGEFFVDYKNQHAENLKELKGRKVIVEYDFEELDWEITDQTEMINDRLCRIAVNRRYEAGLNDPKEIVTVVWIDENYKSNIAPFGLVGLNGLVVKVNFNNHYEVVLSELFTRDNLKINPFKTKHRISLSEYFEEIEKLILERRARNKG